MKTEYEIITGQNIKRLENGSIIHRYSHVVKGAEIGENVMIAEHCYIGGSAIIGDNSRIQNHVSVFDGVEIGKNVFIAPKVCFTNHHNPQDRLTRKETDEFIPDKIIVEDNATICANATIIAPCVIGEGARIGAASVVLTGILAKEQKNGLIKKRGKQETSKKKVARRKKK